MTRRRSSRSRSWQASSSSRGRRTSCAHRAAGHCGAAKRWLLPMNAVSHARVFVEVRRGESRWRNARDRAVAFPTRGSLGQQCERILAFGANGFPRSRRRRRPASPRSSGPSASGGSSCTSWLNLLEKPEVIRMHGVERFAGQADESEPRPSTCSSTAPRRWRRSSVRSFGGDIDLLVADLELQRIDLHEALAQSARPQRARIAVVRVNPRHIRDVPAGPRDVVEIAFGDLTVVVVAARIGTMPPFPSSGPALPRSATYRKKKSSTMPSVFGGLSTIDRPLAEVEPSARRRCSPCSGVRNSE